MAKRSSVKDTIIETASTLFYQNGYNLTGINEIIREAGIAKATLYSHFRSKEDICVAYLKFKNATFLNDLNAFVMKRPKGKKQIIALFDFLETFFDHKSFNGCWCIKTAAEIPLENVDIKAEIQYQKNQFLNFISDLVSANLPDSSSKENVMLAKQIYLLYESAITESHLHGKAWPISTAKKMSQKLLA